LLQRREASHKDDLVNDADPPRLGRVVESQSAGHTFSEILRSPTALGLPVSLSHRRIMVDDGRSGSTPASCACPARSGHRLTVIVIDHLRKHRRPHTSFNADPAKMAEGAGRLDCGSLRGRGQLVGQDHEPGLPAASSADARHLRLVDRGNAADVVRTNQQTPANVDSGAAATAVTSACLNPAITAGRCAASFSSTRSAP
jgi:hypothetical protein